MLAFRLAFKDFRKDAKPFFGLSVALAAILAPLLIMMALKTGITGAMLSELRSDPTILEIEFLNNATLDTEALETIAALDGVGFIANLPRSMGESVMLLTQTNRATGITLRSSGEGDPYLDGLPPPQDGEIILSSRSSAEIDVTPGDPLIVVLVNPLTDEEFDVPVTFVGTSTQLLGRFALLHPDIVFAAEAVARGKAVPAFGIPGEPDTDGSRDVGRVRIFADALVNVGPLARSLERLGYVVDGQWDRVENVLRLERNLEILLSVIAALSGIGFAISFAISIWVNVERKRKSLAMLRLMGTSARSMILFPVVQAISVAAIGVSVAFILFVGVRTMLNRAFEESLPNGAQIAGFPAEEIVLVIVVTFGVALLAGALGGVSIARLEPKEAMRDG